MPAIIVSGERYPCTGVVTIGRGETCTIRLRMTSTDHGGYIGRLHATISAEPPMFTDLSENGSYVNGIHVFGRSVALEDGDQIRIGDVDLQFVAV
ncbi:MAG: Inner rane component of cytoplasmic domain [Myxococcales bacterium]|nr:Inner rane component of cytoplasmic domain [Myxococcales bacterium]